MNVTREHRRRQTTADHQKEQFFKTQESSISKATNDFESPIKAKHLRVAILGTHNEKGSTAFWHVSTKLPLKVNQIVCWKFCFILHKILREGHANSVPGSFQYTQYLKTLGDHWACMYKSRVPGNAVGYNELNAAYCNLLVSKLTFHERNPEFPGTLVLHSTIETVLGTEDPNLFFPLAVELLDYMDCLLVLSEKIFSSMNLAFNNSMTSMGQLKLSPVVPVIQDAAEIYDFLTRLLFKLHCKLPLDILHHHRMRFMEQFPRLQELFRKSMKVVFIKQLVQIKLLPEHPPDFTKKTAIPSREHLAPIKLVEDVQNVNAGEADQLTMSPSDDANDVLIDLQTLSAKSLNGPDNRDRTNSFTHDEVVSQLMKQVSEIEIQLELNSKKLQDNETSRRDLEQRYDRDTNMLKNGLKQSSKQCEELEDELDKLKADGESIVEYENLIRVKDATYSDVVLKHEEKFAKLKAVYLSMREEHICLLRNNADLKKQLRDTEECKVDETSEDSEQADMYKSKISELEFENGKLKVTIGKTFEILNNSFIDKSQYVEKWRDSLHNSVSVYLDRLSSLFDKIVDIQGDDTVQLDHFGSVVPLFVVADDVVSNSSTVFRMANQECKSYQVVEACDTLQDQVVDLLAQLSIGVSVDIKPYRQTLDHISKLCVDVPVNSLGDEDLDVEQEMQNTMRIVETAARRIQDAMHKARESSDPGLKVDVRIFESCTDLMAAVKELVLRTKSLQVEVVVKTSVSMTVKWKEGLITAAKSVGWAATELVNTADELIGQQSSSFDQLAVLSGEIASSTTQLVVASRVKADPSSECLSQVVDASHNVKSCAGRVVAIAREVSDNIAESTMFDFSQLSLTQTKTKEMDCRIKVLELERALESERVSLGMLQKQRYSMAGADEGWVDEET